MFCLKLSSSSASIYLKTTIFNFILYFVFCVHFNYLRLSHVYLYIDICVAYFEFYNVISYTCKCPFLFLFFFVLFPLSIYITKLSKYEPITEAYRFSTNIHNLSIIFCFFFKKNNSRYSSRTTVR